MQGPVARIVLLGAHGVMGRMHAAVYQEMGVAVAPVDIAVDRGPRLSEIDWYETVLDVCTPTATHADCLWRAYELGARRFIIEKPAATDSATWRAVVDSMPEAQLFVVHNYLFSKAFRIVRERLRDPVWFSTVFNKNRAIDDQRGRGAGPDGRLADVLLIEAPHQFAMLLGLDPDLRVISGDRFGVGRSTTEPGALSAASVEFENTTGVSAQLNTDLRRRRERVLRVRERDGCLIEAHFPINSELESTVLTRRPGGATQVVFEGRDDLLAATLAAALRAMESGSIPWEASAPFALSVLERIDDALELALFTANRGVS